MTDIHTYFAQAYDHFNTELFGGKLPSCTLLVHRKKGANGYFWADRWEEAKTDGRKRDGARRHEIALNPENFAGRSSEAILSTLVHEMTHLQQRVSGTPGKGGYHNTEWVGLMEAVGLIPFAVGHEPARAGDKPTKQTGTRVTHSIERGGLFEDSCTRFCEAAGPVPWVAVRDTPAVRARAKAKAASKTKYTCGVCGTNAWAKPDVRLLCGCPGGSMGVEMKPNA